MNKLSYIKTIETKDIQAKVKIDPFSERIWVLDFKGDAKQLVSEINSYDTGYSVGKILCTVRDKERVQLEKMGFKKEAEIEGFFNGEKAYYLAKYPSKERGVSTYIEKENEVLDIALDFKKREKSEKETEDFIIETASEKDVEEMVELFTTVFKTYPTPVDHPDYIKKMMNDEVLFKVARYNGKIISAASADMDSKYLNAEITDCATYPEYRGKGLLNTLMNALEKELAQKSYKTMYTIARAGIIGINRAFAKRGYIYKGRLVNNCHIGGRMEDMNIWVKQV